nr:hypothetical protein SEVIR_1G221866v2 [Ipomoea batatas]
MFSFFLFSLSSLFCLFSILFCLISSFSSFILSLYAFFISFSFTLCSSVFPFLLTCTADDLCVRACFHFLPDTFPAITPSYVAFPTTALFGSSEEGTACLFDGGGPFSFSTSMAASSSSDTSPGVSFSALFRFNSNCIASKAEGEGGDEYSVKSGGGALVGSSFAGFVSEGDFKLLSFVGFVARVLSF